MGKRGKVGRQDGWGQGKVGGSEVRKRGLGLKEARKEGKEGEGREREGEWKGGMVIGE